MDRKGGRRCEHMHDAIHAIDVSALKKKWIKDIVSADRASRPWAFCGCALGFALRQREVNEMLCGTVADERHCLFRRIDLNIFNGVLHQRQTMFDKVLQ